MVARAVSRRYYIAAEGGAMRPRFDPRLSLRDNVLAIATWEWGDRRAAWAADLADEVDVSGDDHAEWVAAVLCAAAVAAGRDRTTGWNRTLNALTEMTGVPRDVMLDHFAQIRAMQATA